MNDIEKTEEIKGKSKIESIPLDLISMSDTLPPDIEYVFPALPVGTVGIISAGGGVGKSFWMNQAVLQVAVGGSCDFGLVGQLRLRGGLVLLFILISKIQLRLFINDFLISLTRIGKILEKKEYKMLMVKKYIRSGILMKSG